MEILKKSVTSYREQTGETGYQIQSSPFKIFTAKFIASGFWVGYVPFAQGTVGSLWGPFLFLFLPKNWGVDFYSEVSIVILASIFFLFFLGIWSASVCENLWGHDPGRIVIDEIVGMFLTLVFIPLTFKTVWLGFFLFRVVDIIKPPPVRRLEKLPHGWGVMIDDLIAGLYANILLRIMIYFFSDI